MFSLVQNLLVDLSFVSRQYYLRVTSGILANKTISTSFSKFLKRLGLAYIVLSVPLTHAVVVIPTGSEPSLELSDIIDVLNGEQVVLSDDTLEVVKNTYQAIMNSGALGQPVYGLTRAYGANSELKIPAVFQYDEQGYAVDLKPDSIPMSRYLNMNFIYDDDAGSDPYVKACRTHPGNEDAVLDDSYDKVMEKKRARAVTLMMAIAMARGNLTVRPELAERAKDLLNYKIYPVIPRVFHADTASQADLIPVNAWLLGAIGYTQDAANPADPLPMPFFQAQTLYKHPTNPQAPVGACFWGTDGNIGTTKQVMSPHFGDKLQLPFYGDDSLAMSQNAFAMGSMLLMYAENKSIIETAIARWKPAVQPSSAEHDKTLGTPITEATIAYQQFLKDFKMALNTSATNPIIARKFMKAEGPEGNKEIQKRAVLGSGFFDITFIAHSFKVMAGFVAESTIQARSDSGNYEKNAQVMGFVRSANQAKTISGYKDDYSPQTANLVWNFEDMLPYVKHAFKPSAHPLPDLQPYQRDQLDTILDTTYALVVNQEAIMGADGKQSALVDLIGSARSVMLEGRREVLNGAYRAKQRLAGKEYESVVEIADLNAVLQSLATLADYTFRVRRAYNKISPSGPLFFAINTLNYGIDDGPNRGAYYHITKIRSLADVSGLVPLTSSNGELPTAPMAAILEDRIHRVLKSYEVMLGVEVYTVRTAVEYLAKYSDMDFSNVAARLLEDPAFLPYQVRAEGIPFRKYDAMKNSIGMDLISTIEGVAKGVYAKKGIVIPPSITPPSIEALMREPCVGSDCNAYDMLELKVAECCATEDGRVQYTARLNDLKFALALQQKTPQQKTRALEYMTPTRLNLLYKSLYRKPYVATGWEGADNSAEDALQDVADQLAIAASEDQVITDAMHAEAVEAAIKSVEEIIGGDDKSYPLYDLLGLSFNGRNANTWAFDTLWRFQDPSRYNPDTGEDTREYPFNLMPTHLPVTQEAYHAAKQLSVSSWGEKGNNRQTSFTNVFLDDPSAEGMPAAPELYRTLLTIDPEERGLQDNMSYRTIPAQLGQIVQSIKEISHNGKRASVHFWDLNGLLADFSRQTWKRWSYAFHEAHLPGSYDKNIFQPWALEKLSLNAVDGTKALSQWYSAGHLNDAATQDTYYAALATVRIVKYLKELLAMEAIASARMVKFRKEALGEYSQITLDGTVKKVFKRAKGCASKKITLSEINACADKVFK